MFKEELYQNTIMGGGFGMGVDWSQEKPNNTVPTEKTEQDDDDDANEEVATPHNPHLKIE